MTDKNKIIENELNELKLFFHDQFSFLVSEYKMIETHSICNRKSIHFDKLHESDRRLDYTLEIIYENPILKRKIVFRYNDGHNADKIIINSMTLQILKTNEKIPETYRIEDYARLLNLDFNENRFFVKKTFEDSLLKAEGYIRSCVDILKNEELKRILCFDYWIKVPIDMSPYK